MLDNVDMYLYCAVLLRSCVLVLCQDRSWIEVNSFVKLVCLFQQPIVSAYSMGCF